MSGNLRDHDGRKGNRSGIMATAHYDGDYGASAPTGSKQRIDPRPVKQDPSLTKVRTITAQNIGVRG